MTDTKKKDRPARRPDCVTEVRMGNTGLTVSDYVKGNGYYFLFECRTRKYPIQ